MLTRNLAANYFGQAWSALMSLLFVPFYVHILGIETYGLVAFFALLQAWLALLDMGIRPTLSREMARHAQEEGGVRTALDLFRSAEIVTGCVSIMVATTLWIGAPWLATKWLKPGSISVEDTTIALGLMGVVAALRLNEGICASALEGLERQVGLNLTVAATATVRGLGAIGVLHWVSPTIAAYFLWNAAISVTSLIVLRVQVRSVLREPGYTGRFSPTELRRVAGFAAGITTVVVPSLLLTQLDKLLLSKLLALDEFARYALAALLAGGLYSLAGPVARAWFPRLSALAASRNEAAISSAFHRGAQLCTVLVGSAGLILIVFSRELLRVWTHNDAIAEQTGVILSLLACGNMLHTFMYIPYQTQLAFGWTALTAKANVALVVLTVPAVIWAVPRYGGVGAAVIWVGANVGSTLVISHLMFRRILVAEAREWRRRDVLQPLSAALVVAVSARALMGHLEGIVGMVPYLALSSIATLVAATLAAPLVRSRISRLVGFGAA